MDNTNINDSFIWWIGVIEDRKDPLKLGRCKVRILNFHTQDKSLLPTEELHYAFVIYSPNNKNTYSPYEGDRVLGFFADGEKGQVPIIFGVMGGIPQSSSNPQMGFNDPRTNDELINAPRKPKNKTYNIDGSGISIEEKEKADSYPNILDEPTSSRLARNDSDTINQTFIQERKDNVVKNVETVSGSWTEPETKYDTEYPYNNVTETESGHIFEFDDTFGKERIHLAHRSGTFLEMFPDGTKVEKITKDNYQIVMGDEHVYIMGKCFVTIQGNAELKIKGNFDALVDGTCKVESKGNMTFIAPRIDLNP